MPIHSSLPWWQEYFKHSRPFFDAYDKKATAAEVRYYIKKLSLTENNSLLDCPCGPGRIAIPIAKKGIAVTGVDITESYIEELAWIANINALPIKTVCLDMRKIEYDNCFDAAINVCTSFGYFDKESDNRKSLKKIFRALKPGGGFIMQVVNRDWLIRHFQSRGWRVINSIKVLEERTFDYSTSRLYGTLILLKNGQETVIRSILRTYSYHELYSLFYSVGFREIEGFGSIKEDPLSADFRDMFLYAIKPK